VEAEGQETISLDIQENGQFFSGIPLLHLVIFMSRTLGVQQRT
jgi:hypothetical protein